MTGQTAHRHPSPLHREDGYPTRADQKRGLALSYDLHALPGAVREAVLETLAVPETLATREPESGKRLLGRLDGFWSARVGSYRILYTIESSGVLVRATRHRAAAYGRRPTR